MVAHAAVEGAVTAGLTSVATFLLLHSCSKFEALALLTTSHIFYHNITNSTNHDYDIVCKHDTNCFCYDVSKLIMCDRVILIFSTGLCGVGYILSLAFTGQLKCVAPAQCLQAK